MKIAVLLLVFVLCLKRINSKKFDCFECKLTVSILSKDGGECFEPNETTDVRKGCDYCNIRIYSEDYECMFLIKFYTT